MLTGAPDLTTARLVLRAHRREDYADQLSLWSDPAVVRYIGNRPSTPEEVWQRLLRYSGHWPLLGFGYWIAHERETGLFVGEVGLADLHRDIDPPLDAPESGWVLAPWCHGRGFATELMTTVLDWGDRVLGASRTVCIIDPQHTASLRVAAKLGYHELRRAQYHGDEIAVLERPNPVTPLAAAG
jgi:RimJ/RimL family protein N-acetyltransferase